MESNGSIISYAFQGHVLKRNLAIALIVGTLLSLTNQLDVLLSKAMTPLLVIKIAFNYVIPFVVSTVSTAVNRE